jgi:bifunctional non-homologous end joining protein LigD
VVEDGRHWSVEFAAITAAVMSPAVLQDRFRRRSRGADFHALLGRSGAATACLYAFDLLHVGRDDLRPLELIGRRVMLKKLLRKAGPPLVFSEHLEAEDGEAMFRHACALGFEGTVSKRVTSRYKSGRCDAWRKVKNPAYTRVGA